MQCLNQISEVQGHDNDRPSSKRKGGKKKDGKVKKKTNMRK